MGNRRRERFPFDTRNMDFIHVAIWLHDHGLSPHNPQVEDIKQWACLVRETPLSNEQMDEDGDWNTSLRNLQGVLDEYSRQLTNIQLQFHYPPQAPSAHSRLWSTASEITMDQQCLQTSMNHLYPNIADNEEDDAEMEVKVTTSTNPDVTNAGKDTT